MWRSSAADTRKTTGVTTAPARHSALYNTGTSGQLAMTTTTRSPGHTPSRRSPDATRLARSSSAPDECQTPSNHSVG